MQASSTAVQALQANATAYANMSKEIYLVPLEWVEVQR